MSWHSVGKMSGLYRTFADSLCQVIFERALRDRKKTSSPNPFAKVPKRLDIMQTKCEPIFEPTLTRQQNLSSRAIARKHCEKALSRESRSREPGGIPGSDLSPPDHPGTARSGIRRTVRPQVYGIELPQGLPGGLGLRRSFHGRRKHRGGRGKGRPSPISYLCS